LVVREKSTGRVQELQQKDHDMAVWWGTPTECWSALARLEREGRLSDPSAGQAAESLRKLLTRAHEVLPSPAVRATAKRLLFSHPLRAADALQLAAAVVLAGADVEELEFVTLDEALAVSARREGFRVLGT
jgi:predicted nucleic acid-binding protein